MKLQSLLHFRTNVKDNIPTSNDIELGEIAINHATDGETLFIKNNDEKIAEFKDTKYYSKITDDIYSKLDTIDNTIEENELVTATALTDLNERVTLVENGEIGDPFFKSFATLSEYETAVANGEVVYPCVSYIIENSIIKFELSASTYNAIVTVTQQLIDNLGALNVKPLTFNPEYYETFEIDGEDYLSNIAIFEDRNVIPFPSFNLGDTFNINFKLKNEPQFLVENASDMFSVVLFYASLSYFEIDESFYKRVTGTIFDDTVKECPIGFYMSTVGPNFTCKFKGDYGVTDTKISYEMLSGLIYGLPAMAGQYTDTHFYGRLQIPSGNETYGYSSDMYDENNGTGATFYGIINYLTQVFTSAYSNLHITIETY